MAKMACNGNPPVTDQTGTKCYQSCRTYTQDLSFAELTMCNLLGRGGQGVCFGHPPDSSLRVARFALHEPQERFGIVMIRLKLQEQRELTASPLRFAAPTEQLDELRADVVEGRTQTHSSFELVNGVFGSVELSKHQRTCLS